MPRHIILRIVPRGATALGWSESLDLDAPCDLVHLDHEQDEEREIDRREYDSGHAASREMLALLSGRESP
jgi:hypothetical protein